MTSDLEIGLYIFLLAGFLGYHIITRVPPLLHTPLMSATNAISGISLIGSLVVTAPTTVLSTILGTIAVACSSTNVVGGFLITDRMLKMFKRTGDQMDRTRRRLATGPILGAPSLLPLRAPDLRGGGPAGPGAAGRAQGGVSHQALSFLYIASALLFILGLKGLSSRAGRAEACSRRKSACSWHRRHAVPSRDRQLRMDRGGVGVDRSWGPHGSPDPDDGGAATDGALTLTRGAGRDAHRISEYIRHGSALGGVKMTAIGFEVVIAP